MLDAQNLCIPRIRQQQGFTDPDGDLPTDVKHLSNGRYDCLAAQPMVALFYSFFIIS